MAWNTNGGKKAEDAANLAIAATEEMNNLLPTVEAVVIAHAASTTANLAIIKARDAEDFATDANEKSTTALTLSETVKSEFDRIVAEAGDSNPEVVLARGNYVNLPQRLDTEITGLTQQLEHIVVDAKYPPPPFLPVKWDNATDDTAKLNAMMGAFSHIKLPFGAGLINGVLNWNKQLILEGQGEEFTTINFNGTGTLFKVGDIDDARNSVFTKAKVLSLKGKNSPTGEICFDMTTSNNRNITFTNVIIEGFSGSGIKIFGGWNRYIGQSLIRNCGNGIFYDGKNIEEVGTWAASGDLIENVYISHCNTGIKSNYAWECEWNHVVFERNTIPFDVNVNRNLVASNLWIENNTQDPIINGSMLMIGGRTVDTDLLANYTQGSGNATAALVQVRGNAISVDIKNKQLFKVDGSGVTAFKPTKDVGFQILDSTATQSSTVDDGLAKLIKLSQNSKITARKRQGTASEPIFGITGLASYWSTDVKDDLYTSGVFVGGYSNATGGGKGFGTLEFHTGQIEGTANVSVDKKWEMDSSGHFIAGTDNTVNIGSSTKRVKDIYASNATIQTSDLNKKTDISEEILGLNFINALTPKAFKMIDGDSGRTHSGLIAQDVEQVLQGLGIDRAMLIKAPEQIINDEATDENDIYIETGSVAYGLRYTELIAPLIKAIQELSEEVNRLKSQSSTD